MTDDKVCFDDWFDVQKGGRNVDWRRNGFSVVAMPLIVPPRMRTVSRIVVIS